VDHDQQIEQDEDFQQNENDPSNME